MAQTGYTPISIYYSATATNTPTAGNLVAGELAINTADGKLFYKDSAGVVQVIGTKGGVGSSTTTQVLYNSSGLVVGSANMTFSGTALTLANDASISGLTVGKGGGSLANTVFGYRALFNASNTGNGNTAIGRSVLESNTSGQSNTGVGSTYNANPPLYANTTGSYNSAFGEGSLASNTTASGNTAVGYQSSYSNTTGDGVGIGYQALYSNTTGGSLTAVGYQALRANTTANHNSAFGDSALLSNTTGATNTAIGKDSLRSNTTASNNTAVGYQAGYSGTTAQYNTFMGTSAGYGITTGARNTFVGAWNSGSTGSGSLVTTGSANTILGAYNGNQNSLDIRTASNYIVLSDGDGNPRQIIDGSGIVIVGGGVVANANAGGARFQVQQANNNWVSYVGNTQATGNIYGQYINFTGQAPNDASSIFLYCGDTVGQKFGVKSNGGINNYSANNTNLSDAREKKNIQLAGNYLDKLCQVPVKTFLFNDQTDTDLNLGTTAQDLQAVCPELVTEVNWGTKEEPKMRLSIYETDLKYAMLKAIQELKAEVDSLKQQLGK